MARIAAVMRCMCFIAAVLALSALPTSQARAEQAVGFDPSRSALGQQYRQMEASYLSSGRLRTDRTPADAAYDHSALMRNFSAIALGREYNGSNGGWLVRWREPVRMHVVFGPSVPAAHQASDRVLISNYAQRLSRISGHPIRLTRDRFNFLVLVVTDAELRGLGGFLTENVPELSAQSVRRISRLPHTNLCMVVTVPYADRSRGIARAVAIVRAEHPPIMRRSCVEEELAQGMGLPNDHRSARPSIFNDDEEFAVLTQHDEMLLRALYDHRLAPGMGSREVQSVLPQILGSMR